VINVIFVEPAFPDNQREFVRALHAAGANVIGIGERPADWLGEDLHHWISHYEQIGSVVDEDALLGTVKRIQSQLHIDRLEATVEAHVLATARVREECGISGTSVKTAWLCRDKPAMKEALRAAGVPCARSIGANSADEVREFAQETGLPLIIKPRDGAGSAGTWRIDHADQLETIIKTSGLADGRPVAVEEFIEGHEGYLDTLSIDGEPVHEFITHYYPNVLKAMRTRWISPQMVTTNKIDAPGYSDVRTMARRVNRVIGIDTTATHMEWFYGPKGLKFSEIACRPPGVCQWDVYNAANEFDLYLEWADAIVHGRANQTPSRRFACGMIALRPDRDGSIIACEGLEDIQARFGEWIVASHFPAPGASTQPVEAGYMANAWVRIRHPDYDHLRWMMDAIGRTVQVRAG
jgi:carbamoylphosphate synthase large subunit